MTTDDNRAAFEAWAESKYMEVERIIFDNLDLYEDSETDVSWRAWQAAIEHAMKTMCDRS